VRVGGVVNPGLAQVAQVLLVLLDLLIAPGQVQRHLRHVVDAGVADVPHGDAGVGVALLDLLEAFGGAQIRRRGPRSHTPQPICFQNFSSSSVGFAPAWPHSLMPGWLL
jgi:hypothetical protein